MTFFEILLYSSLYIVFILVVIRFASRAELEDRVELPLCVWMDHLNSYTAQQVYNWVVYITKVSGKRYLEQLAWNPQSQHDFLLSDLRTVLQAKNQDELLTQLKLVGESHNLDTSIVDAPY